MALGDGIRRNAATLSTVELNAVRDAFLGLDKKKYSDKVSYWFKQDQIHSATHVHEDASFLPWHRELVNRFELLLQEVNPLVSLPYWDWTTDPKGTLFKNTFMGSSSGKMGAPFGGIFDNNDNNELPSRIRQQGPFTLPPKVVTRAVTPVSMASDETIITTGNGLPQSQQWPAFRNALQRVHNTAHSSYLGGTISDGHIAFQDPFVFLLHCNVDRLFAKWQTVPGQEWRLDPKQVYGDESNDPSLLAELQPWNGTVRIGNPIVPWIPGTPDNQIVHKSSKHPSVVKPPRYDSTPSMVLDWVPVDGGYRVWRFDANSSDPFPNPGPLLKGKWSSIQSGHELIPIDDHVLDWVPGDGSYRLWCFVPTSSDPLPGPVQSGTWSSIRSGHVLIPIGGFVLDWVPADGGYRLWSFDPGASDPLPTKVQSGTWSSIRSGHVLIPIGGFVLDWVPADGGYRLWSFDPGASDPLPTKVQSGTWSSIRSGHRLIPMGGYILDWVPADGSYRLWTFDHRVKDPLPTLKQSGTWGSIRSGHDLITMR